MRLLEPSFGAGDFVLPAVRRLMESWRASKPHPPALLGLSNAILAVELDGSAFRQTKASVESVLKEEGLEPGEASELADRWLVQGDFLLSPLDGEFDFVAGNPPYVRPELIPSSLLKAYRSRYSTMFDRADLYVPFIERSLSLLANGGSLGFICSDRWIKNRYGGPLRGLVARSFRLKYYVDMAGAPAFHSDVAAYASVFIISREPTGPARVSRRPEINGRELSALARTLTERSAPAPGGPVSEVRGAFRGNEPWLLDSGGKAALIRRLEGFFPLLEQTGCRVGIGVATGADKAFIGDYETMDVEPSRKLPLATTMDIASGEVRWGGLAVLNPFLDSGELANLREFPRMARWLEARKAVILGRNVARKSPKSWYRTVDRIWPALASRRKLLIPDIKCEAHVVYEHGFLYPSHNLYYVTSEEWDLAALQAVLMSSVSRLFVSAYSTRIRGGSLRFQAQYLRRIRIPCWDDVPSALRQALSKAAVSRDLTDCDLAAFELYRISASELESLKETS
ncbi:MAG: Eco57I restriction-modification methylase domain-containing protein [Deltaproteobacteria bacterium]|jgi:hypothetical protein|nr:Eco57I restriction-modification methylase domain-containing protein [Deltaproteobacteria bacterium]